MYQPAHHREDRLDVQHALMRAFPLGTLVTLGPSGLVANHIPFLIDPEASKLGTLRAHVARANLQWRDFDPSREALVIFQGAERSPGTRRSARPGRWCRPGITPS